MVMDRMNPWSWTSQLPNLNHNLNPKPRNQGPRGCQGQRREDSEDGGAEAEEEGPTATTMISTTPSSPLTHQPEEERGLPATSGQADPPLEVIVSLPLLFRGCRPGDPPGPPVSSPSTPTPAPPPSTLTTNQDQESDLAATATPSQFQRSAETLDPPSHHSPPRRPGGDPVTPLIPTMEAPPPSPTPPRRTGPHTPRSVLTKTITLVRTMRRRRYSSLMKGRIFVPEGREEEEGMFPTPSP